MNPKDLVSGMENSVLRREAERVLVWVATVSLVLLLSSQHLVQIRAQIPGAAVAGLSLEEVRREFESPPAAARPMVRWWWPGGDVTDEEISRELRLMKDAGIGGVEIQSFKIGLNPKLAPDVEKRVNSFLTPEWFGHVKHAIEEGQKLGMIVDLTFGSGWPFGGPHIPPELAARQLNVEWKALRGPTTHEGKIPWVEPEPAPQLPPEIASLFGTPTKDPKLFKLVAVVAVRGTPPEIEHKRFPEMPWTPPLGIVKRSAVVDPQSAVALTSQVKPDLTLEWKVPEGDWLLFSFIQGPTGQQVVGGAGAGTQFVLDHMQKAALQKHIEAIGEPAKKYFGDHFGKTFRAIFCDSLEVTANNVYWTDGFLSEFQKRRGYDLTPYLPLVKHPGFGDPYAEYPSLALCEAPEVTDRVQHDYWQTVSDVMIENFYQPYIDWAQKNRLKARIQAHGAPTNNLLVYGHSDIPETEDLYADGRYDFLKFSSSGGHLYGRKVVASESFVWMNKDYETTPEKMKVYADELLTAGINQILYHGFPYEYMDRPGPGWHPFSSNFVPIMTFSSHLNHRNPFWEYLRPLNDYMARIQFISQTGHFVAPVALYSPYSNFPSWTASDANHPLEYSLMAHGYNFDFINEDILLNHAGVKNRELHTPGSTYKVLVLRNQRRLTLALVEKLGQFSREGLPIVFAEALPTEEISFPNYVENGQKIRQAIAAMLDVQAPETVTGRAQQQSGSTLFVREATRVPNLLDAALGVKPNLKFASSQPHISFAQFDHGPVKFYFFRNAKPVAQNTRVTFEGRGLVPEVWDPWTGQVSAAAQSNLASDAVSVELHLEPYGSRLIALRGAPEVRHVTQSNFDELRLIDGRLSGIAKNAGVYQAVWSDGKTVDVTVGKDEIPTTLTLGPGWKLHAAGKDKNGKEYTREANLAELKDWTLIQDLRFFSGKGRYSVDFHLDGQHLKSGLGLDLDLGQVHDVAEVWINQNKVASLLLRPYRLDATPYLRVGDNHLEVIVANTLRNRLVGDGMGGDPYFVIFKQRYFFLPSGMIGPVRLIPYRRVELE